jgi:hypothetical protein
LDGNAILQPPSGAPPPTLAPAPAAQPRSTTQTQGTGTTTTAGTKRASKPSSSNHKLDTDENFLRAVNSTKRGKKLEDDFDREFNLLRIAKPKKVDGVASTTTADAAVGHSEVPVAPWDAIDDFGDVGIRGNFMIVVDMNIERGGSAKPSQSARTDCTTHPEWAGRLNFKKFKAVRIILILVFFFFGKCTDGRTGWRRKVLQRSNAGRRSSSFPARRTTTASEKVSLSFKSHMRAIVRSRAVPLYFAAYWRSGASGSQSYSDAHDITAAHPPPLHGKSKPASKASQTSTDTRGRRGKARAREDDDHEDEDIIEDVDMDTDEMDLDAPPSIRRKAGAKAKAPVAAIPKGKTTAKGKAKSSAKTKRSPARTKKAPATRATPRGKGKNAPALFLSDSEEDEAEDEVQGGDGGGSDADEMGESAAAVAAVLGVRGDEVDEVEDETVTRGTGAFAHGEPASVAGEERADAGMTSTLRSTAGTQLRREAVRAAKRRAAAMGGGNDDDSDDAVFKGFGNGRKRGRVR